MSLLPDCPRCLENEFVIGEYRRRETNLEAFIGVRDAEIVRLNRRIAELEAAILKMTGVDYD